MRGAADTTLQKDMKETQPLVFQPLTSPFDFLTVENEIILELCPISKGKYGHPPQIPTRLRVPQKFHAEMWIKGLTAHKQKVKLNVRVLFF